jgi:hypothetical protein
MTDVAAQSFSPAKLGIKRHENFESWYSNNIQMQPTEWDLKCFFGEMEIQQDGTPVVQQHTAIVQSWLQAKIMNYFLTLQLSVYELTHGKIPIPPSAMPSEPVPPSGAIDTPDTRVIYEFIKKFREDFVVQQQMG